MSEHHVTVCWNRGEVPFEYKVYPRDHTWAFPGGIEVKASAAPDYLGSADLVDPEEAFVASLSSCHMLSFLALAANAGVVVNSYEDDAVGLLEKNEDRKLAITRVTLRPRIVFDDPQPGPDQIDALHHRAHSVCFIANSVKTEVTVAGGVTSA